MRVRIVRVSADARLKERQRVQMHLLTYMTRSVCVPSSATATRTRPPCQFPVSSRFARLDRPRPLPGSGLAMSSTALVFQCVRSSATWTSSRLLSPPAHVSAASPTTDTTKPHIHYAAQPRSRRPPALRSFPHGSCPLSHQACRPYRVCLLLRSDLPHFQLSSRASSCHSSTSRCIPENSGSHPRSFRASCTHPPCSHPSCFHSRAPTPSALSLKV